MSIYAKPDKIYTNGRSEIPVDYEEVFIRDNDSMFKVSLEGKEILISADTPCKCGHRFGNHSPQSKCLKAGCKCENNELSISLWLTAEPVPKRIIGEVENPDWDL
jgi:hypothetical protein